MTARSKRARVTRPPRKDTTPKPRYSEAQIDDAANIGEEQRAGQHAVDLRNALRCYYGYSFEVPLKGIRDSLNMLWLTVGAMAHVKGREVEAANWVIRELTPQHRGTVHPMTGKRIAWGGDELMSNRYESWLRFGMLLALRGLARFSTLGAAVEMLRVELLRAQAFYALLAVPGVTRNPNGGENYRGPVVRCAGLRSFPRGMGNPSTTPVAWALLDKGQGKTGYTKDPGPLARAIYDLAEELMPHGTRDSLLALWQPPADWTKVNSTVWESAVVAARMWLTGTRTAYPYEIRVYGDGTKVSMLLGPIGATSTAQVRCVIVRGPELADCVVVSPHGDDERTVRPSDAWLSEVASGPNYILTLAGVGPVMNAELPHGEPVLRVCFGPDADPEWSVK